jgi:hypothetical protein
MKKELQDKLYKKYPKLYRQNTLSMQETCMCWGICCGDGWYDLIDKLSAKLEAYGFVEAAQVKEKFGGLRFYVDGCDSDSFDEIHKHIREAEELSYKTCERCGQPGETKGGGWVRTLCDDCRDSE